jgi:hypothetical protein
MKSRVNFLRRGLIAVADFSVFETGACFGGTADVPVEWI